MLMIYVSCPREKVEEQKQIETELRKLIPSAEIIINAPYPYHLLWKCDAFIVCEGWEKDAMCLIEEDIATDLRVPIYNTAWTSIKDIAQRINEGTFTPSDRYLRQRDVLCDRLKVMHLPQWLGAIGATQDIGVITAFIGNREIEPSDEDKINAFVDIANIALSAALELKRV